MKPQAYSTLEGEILDLDIKDLRDFSIDTYEYCVYNENIHLIIQISNDTIYLKSLKSDESTLKVVKTNSDIKIRILLHDNKKYSINLYYLTKLKHKDNILFYFNGNGKIIMPNDRTNTLINKFNFLLGELDEYYLKYKNYLL